MFIGTYTCYDSQRKNDIIFKNKPIYSSYDYEWQNYNELYKLIKDNGHEIEVINSFEDIEKYDCFLVIDTWKNDLFEKKILNSSKKKIKIVTEPPSLKIHYWDKKKLGRYDYILTFYDPHIDNKKYFKYLDAWLPFEPKLNFKFNEKKFAIMINSNKKSNHKNELYSERLKIIKYYEKNNDYGFDLYGRDWDRIVFPLNSKLSILNSNKFKFIFKHNMVKKWRGTIKRKEDILPMYKFNFCLENYLDLSGWITEKIFDAFANGNIPIYSGSKDIDKYIPNNTYINYFDFKNIEELNQYLVNITENEYNDYIENFKDFRSSSKFKVFEKDSFAKIFLKILRLIK